MSKTKETKEKSLIVKILICVSLGAACGIVGYFIGGAAKRADLTAKMEAMKSAASEVMLYLLPALYVIVMAALTAAAVGIYIKVVRTYKTLGKDDEDEIMRLESRLNTPTTLMNICTILNCLFFSFMAELAAFEHGLGEKTIGKGLAGGSSLFFVLAYIVIFIVSRKCVELEKKMNPELQGDLLDVDFQKKWKDSFDEAQQIIAGKAAFRAFRATQYICAVMWVVSFAAQLVLNVGLTPVICVSVIWLVSTTVYCAECSKLEK